MNSDPKLLSPLELKKKSRKSKIYTHQFRKYFYSITNFPENNAYAIGLPGRIASIARGIINLWSPENFGYLDRNYINERFTKTTRKHINYADIQIHLNRAVFLLDIFEDRILSNRNIPTSYSQMSENYVIVANLLYTLHYLDDEIIEAKANLSSNKYSRVKKVKGAAKTKSIRAWWRIALNKVATKYLNEDISAKTYKDFANLIIDEIRKETPSNIDQPLSPENLARAIGKNTELAKKIRNKFI